MIFALFVLFVASVATKVYFNVVAHHAATQSKLGHGVTYEVWLDAHRSYRREAAALRATAGIPNNTRTKEMV